MGTEIQEDNTVLEMDGGAAYRIKTTELYCIMVKIINVMLCLSDHNF